MRLLVRTSHEAEVLCEQVVALEPEELPGELPLAARLLTAPVSTSRRISLQISMSLRTPVSLCRRGYRPDQTLPENGTVVHRHFGPPRHGPRTAVFDRRQHFVLQSKNGARQP